MVVVLWLGLVANAAAMVMNELTSTATLFQRILGLFFIVIPATGLLLRGERRQQLFQAMVWSYVLLSLVAWLDALYLRYPSKPASISVVTISLWIPVFYGLFFAVFRYERARLFSFVVLALYVVATLPHGMTTMTDSEVLSGLWFPLSLATAQTVVILVIGLYARFELRLQQVQGENEELAALRDQLQEESQRKSDFLATMSHELRTPLTGVIGFAEVLEEGLYGELNEVQKRATQDIYSSGRHLLTLVNDILDLSKIEAGRAELEPSTFSVEPLVDEALTVVAEPARKKNLRLVTDLPADIPLTLTADRRRVKQVLYNYLSNAVKFSEPNTTITVYVTTSKDEVRFEVRDQGVGIAPDDLDRLFRRFSQVDSSDARKYEGTGLGLALVKLLVELHDGQVWVHSAPGEGSTFGFALPRRPANTSSETAREGAEARP